MVDQSRGNPRQSGPRQSGPRQSGSRQSGQSAAEARAEYEAGRAETRAAREQTLREAFPEGDPARWISVLEVAATVVFVLATVLAAIDPKQFVGLHFVVSVSMFGVGFLVFMAVLVAMALRSRDDMLSITGVFFLSGSAPGRARIALLGSLAVQILVSVAGAAARPFTPVAVGTLVPVLGLATCGWWAVRYGHFEPHQTDVRR